MADVALEGGLPANLDAERFVLGGILMDDTRWPDVAGALSADDFSLEKHRRIFLRMGELHERGERIDRVTVANELQSQRQLESVNGLTYLVSLDDGLPTLVNFDSYIRIVREKSRLRALIFRAQNLQHQALLDNGTPARELAETFSQELAGIATSDAENAFSTADEILTACGGIRHFTHPLTGESRGIETGFRRFDQMTGGLQKGDLIVLAARPSMGKTALALNIAHHVAVGSQRLSVAIMSLEMAKEALLGRLLCSAARVDSSKQRAGYLNCQEQSRLVLASEQLRSALLSIDDSPVTGVMDLHAKLRRLKSERGLSLVVVDYLQLMTGGKFENRNQEISAISRGLKLLAKELDVPMLVLSQLSRAPETRSGDHRPQLSDLRESGSIEQDADVVAFIYREEVYKPEREDLRGVAELKVAKQRNGPTGPLNLVFLKELTRFEDRASSASEEQRQ